MAMLAHWARRQLACSASLLTRKPIRKSNTTTLAGCMTNCRLANTKLREREKVRGFNWYLWFIATSGIPGISPHHEHYLMDPSLACLLVYSGVALSTAFSLDIFRINHHLSPFWLCFCWRHVGYRRVSGDICYKSSSRHLSYILFITFIFELYGD